jgi:hypothetical protein
MALIVYIYNSNTGVVAPIESVMATLELHSGLGWHGPFKSKQEAIDFYNRNKAGNPGWKAPIGVTDIGKAIDNAGDSATGAFKGLNLETWILRIGEIVLGVVLIGVGLAKLTGTSNAIAKIAKVAIPG